MSVRVTFSIMYESTCDVPDNQTIYMQLTSPSLPTPPSSNAHEPNCQFHGRRAHVLNLTYLHFERGEVVGDMSAYTITDFLTLIAVYSGLCPGMSVGVMAEAMQG